jgi:hypothetical protein
MDITRQPLLPECRSNVGAVLARACQVIAGLVSIAVQ